MALNHIGLLVVDEIQNVVNSKNGTKETMERDRKDNRDESS